jgi:hypothetical protein
MTMYCPRCRAEYREGFDRCADCGVALVPELPEEPSPESRDVELETVLETTNPALLAMASSLLEAEGIEFLSVGDTTQFESVLPVRIEVDSRRAEQARALLAELEESFLDEDAAEDELEDGGDE